jgi:DNA-binding MarR family transcriptional regulator
MPAAGDIEDLRLLLRRFAMERDRWIAGLCRAVGGSRSDYDALEALDEHGPLSPGELGRLLSLTSGSVTALVSRLEQLGWATRDDDPADRRKVVVSLTDKAWQLGQNELRPYLDAVDATTRRLTPADRATVRRFLEEVVEGIAHAGAPR